MEFKSITEAIDQIAILQKKASEFNESEELKKDMSESLRALETFIISQKTSEPVVQDKKSGVTLSASEFVDFLILKAIDERDSVMRNRQKYSEKDLLGLVIKDKAKFKTLSDTTTMGDWIPTEFQDQVIDLIIDNIAVIVDFIQNIFRWSSGSNTRRYPYIDWYANFYGVEGTTITESNTSDLYFDISAKPFKGMYKWTDEVDMFTIPEMLPILRNALFFGLSISIEDSMINGDTTYTSPNVRRYWDGFRRLALDAYHAADLSTFNITNFRSLRQKLAKFGIRPNELLVVADEDKAYYKMLNDSNFLTIDKVGAKATILTGQLGIYDGIPIKTSSAIPLTDATGEISATPDNNTYGSILIINKRPFAVGFYGSPIVEWDKDITQGITYLVLRQYFGFSSVYTDKGVAVGYKM